MKKKPRKIWVCLACGKWADDKDGLMDVSCYINSVEVDYDKCEFDKVTNRVITVN